MPDIPFLSPIFEAFRRLPQDELDAEGELKELEARLPAAQADHLAALAARRAARDRETIIEAQINEKMAALADSPGVASGEPGRDLALEIVSLQAELVGIRGSAPGPGYVEGRIYPLLVAETRALNVRQDLEHEVRAARDRVDNIRRLRQSDLGRDSDDMARLGRRSTGAAVERIRATNITSEDAGGGLA